MVGETCGLGPQASLIIFHFGNAGAMQENALILLDNFHVRSLITSQSTIRDWQK